MAWDLNHNFAIGRLAKTKEDSYCLVGVGGHETLWIATLFDPSMGSKMSYEDIRVMAAVQLQLINSSFFIWKEIQETRWQFDAIAKQNVYIPSPLYPKHKLVLDIVQNPDLGDGLGSKPNGCMNRNKNEVSMCRALFGLWCWDCWYSTVICERQMKGQNHASWRGLQPGKQRFAD